MGDAGSSGSPVDQNGEPDVVGLSGGRDWVYVTSFETKIGIGALYLQMIVLNKDTSRFRNQAKSIDINLE